MNDFDFSGDRVAQCYDDVLVPTLFRPWAEKMARDHGPWNVRAVLDVATGTGVIPEVLSRYIDPDGFIVATDINSDMLDVARQRCAATERPVWIRESPAVPLDIADDTMDVVICQQGLQFFPDREDAAREFYRVLRKGGRAVASAWQSVDRCEFFGAICDALFQVGEPDIAEMMRKPFDFLPGEELAEHFRVAGFSEVILTEESMTMDWDRGAEFAWEVAYATPIADKLRALPEATQERFCQALHERVRKFSPDGMHGGQMISSVVTATKV
jgi:ubiquinone/menaquinone biosynthesis C-methylase UbiE